MSDEYVQATPLHKVSELVWVSNMSRENSYVAYRTEDSSRYLMVFQDPCWCLRHEIYGEAFRWMGQFPEPQGRQTAQRRAQADYTEFKRKESWVKYMEANPGAWPPPPQEE